MVTVEWTQEEGVTYAVNTIHQVSTTVIGDSSVQLTLLYNTNYNVSVEAALPCQRQAHGHVLLFYGEFNGQETLGVINCHYYS